MRLTIEDVAYGGDGVARDPACGVVFVPGAFVGEVVEAGDTERLLSSPQDTRTGDYINGRFG